MSAPDGAGTSAGRRLVVEAIALNGRWSLTSPHRGDRAAWPPAPDTLFSALVAAAAAEGHARDPALAWLEARGAPIVEAERDPGRTHGVVAYSPVADRTRWDKGARQARRHSAVGSEIPVRWSWPLGAEEDAPVKRLDELARRVPYIGSSRGPVLARARVAGGPPGGTALVPVIGGPLALRVPFPGRLDELERAHGLGRRPDPCPETAYAAIEEVMRGVDGVAQLRSTASSPWGEMISLRKQAGPTLTLDATVPLVEALRRALLAHLGDDAPAALTGHGPRGDAAAEPHLAVVPLARVGDRFAGGEVMGLGLLPPSGLDEDAQAALAMGLGRWLGAGGTLMLGPLSWRLGLVVEHASAPPPARALRRGRHAVTARRGASLTPVGLDRHPKYDAAGRAKRDRSLVEIVEHMCRTAGLPPPAGAEALRHPPHRGGAPARAHALGSRRALRGAVITHLRIWWDRPVRGPILLGRGRHFGLGVLLPEADRAGTGS